MLPYLDKHKIIPDDISFSIQIIIVILNNPYSKITVGFPGFP